jgi:uncharacterized membrane-anchored protein YhcB (DUF1043 family)
MTNNILTLSSSKLMSAYLVPSATLLIGGFMVWKLWQQHQQIKHNQQTQSDLSERLDQLETQEDEVSTAQKDTVANDAFDTSSTKYKKPAASIFQQSSQSGNDPKHGLFEQLISDNIALREAH